MKANTQIILTITVLFLLLFSITFISTIHLTKASGQTWKVPQDYGSIDSAIIAASTSDTIQVGPGTYSGFTVDKTLTIIAQGSSIINGPILITANAVVLSGFTIDGHLTIVADNNKISGNTFESGKIDIGDKMLSGVNIANGNEFSNNVLSAYIGVFVYGSSNNIVDNTMQEGITVYGLDYGYSHFTHNTISRNTITGAYSGIEIISGTYENLVEGNIISSKTGGVLVGSDSNQIIGNTISQTDSSYYGSGIRVAGNSNSIRDNTISWGNDGVSFDGNNFKDNELINNVIYAPKNGINLLHCANSKVEGNKISLAEYGINVNGVIANDQGNSNVFGNTISNCNVGISLNAAINFQLSSNNLVNNKIQATEDGSTNVAWFAGQRGNYWSDWTSPDVNNDGIVDKPYVLQGTGRAIDKYPLVAQFVWTLEAIPTPTPYPVSTPSPSSPTFTSSATPKSNPISNIYLSLPIIIVTTIAILVILIIVVVTLITKKGRKQDNKLKKPSTS